MKNQRGFITLDFLFALVMILGFSGILFILSFTMSVASLTQYITFSAARNYTVAHLTEAKQKERANAKYQELISNPVFKPLYSNDWYKISATPNVGDHTEIIPAYKEAAQDKNQFWGVGTTFVAKVLAFHIPYFGSTTPDTGDDSGDGFKTYIGSYLGREPTTEECQQFSAARWEAIRDMQGGKDGAAYSTVTDGKYYSMTDDGC